jgi:hypothetical protein
MPTNACKKSGCSETSAANSSMTTTRRGSTPPSGDRRYAAKSAAPTSRSISSRRRSSACRHRNARFCEVVVEVGHETDDVRQPRAGVERRTPLVVDQHKCQVIRTRCDRQSGDECAQQFALAGVR